MQSLDTSENRANWFALIKSARSIEVSRLVIRRYWGLSDAVQCGGSMLAPFLACQISFEALLLALLLGLTLEAKINLVVVDCIDA